MLPGGLATSSRNIGRIIDMEDVAALRNEEEVKPVVCAVEPGGLYLGLIFGVEQLQVATGQDVAIVCSEELARDDIRFGDRDGDVFACSLFACFQLEGLCIAFSSCATGEERI